MLRQGCTTCIWLAARCLLHAPKQLHSCLLQGLRTVIITDSEELGTQHLHDAAKHRELWLFYPDDNPVRWAGAGRPNWSVRGACRLWGGQGMQQEAAWQALWAIAGCLCGPQGKQQQWLAPCTVSKDLRCMPKPRQCTADLGQGPTGRLVRQAGQPTMQPAIVSGQTARGHCFNCT